jgi:hypothetical protein
MDLIRCTGPDPAADCSWCGSKIRWEAEEGQSYVLLGVRDETSLERSQGRFVDYPVASVRRTVPAYVRLSHAPHLEDARTDYNLLMVSCGPECAEALGRALESDENAVSVELWTGEAPEGAGVPRSDRRSACSIAPSHDRTYIILRVAGDYTRQRALAHTIEAHRLGRALGINRYLVDMTESRNAESVLANYEFARQEIWDAPEIDKTALVAIVVSPDDHSHDFVETVARNAGLLVRIFRDRALAERHLSANG